MRSELKSDKTDYVLYERTARVYDSQRFQGCAGEWGHDRQISILKNLTKSWQGKKVLEIGCGTGRITQALTRWGAEVTATDISREMLQVAIKRFNSGPEFPTMPDFKMMSVFDIKIDLQDYDYVIMVNVLGRLSKPHEAIHSISSRISENCSFVFNFPCLTSILLPFGLVVNAKGKSLLRDVTSRWFMPSTVEKYCRSAGLEVVSFRGNHYVPVPRLFFSTLPFFWTCDKILANSFPKRCPSVFVECRRLT